MMNTASSIAQLQIQMILCLHSWTNVPSPCLKKIKIREHTALPLLCLPTTSTTPRRQQAPNPSIPSTRDVNGIYIFRPYSNSILSRRVFIRLYPIPSIQYPQSIRIRMLKIYIFMMSIFITILSGKN